MAANEQTHPALAKIAAKVLRTGKATPKEAVALAACVLTQAPDRLSVPDGGVGDAGAGPIGA